MLQELRSAVKPVAATPSADAEALAELRSAVAGAHAAAECARAEAAVAAQRATTEAVAAAAAAAERDRLLKANAELAHEKVLAGWRAFPFWRLGCGR